jgi:starch synthase
MTGRATPRILMVTPEISYLPAQAGGIAQFYRAKAGGLADVTAGLLKTLFDKGADAHLAIPFYRPMFKSGLPDYLRESFGELLETLPENRIHLIENERFTYMESVYSADGLENTRIALAFQKAVIQDIIPAIQPDLIHCHDWMTSLIPAFARESGVPTLFTLHNIHTVKSSMGFMVDHGLDPSGFWRNLYFERMPGGYDESRDTNPVEYMTSGIFAADAVNTVSQSFLEEIIEGEHDFVEKTIRGELARKYQEGRAWGILNAPDASFDPAEDESLFQRYTPAGHVEGKRINKRVLQTALGLTPDPDAPLFFWPSRLDSLQKGAPLLAPLLPDLVNRDHPRPQVVFVADGDYQPRIQEMVRTHGLGERVAVRDFDEHLARIAYGAADFVLMPSRFEPCGLPQMIGAKYGALPIARRTGGIRDTLSPLDPVKNVGNGFLFDTYTSPALASAIEDALAFHQLPASVRHRCIPRVMAEAAARFNPQTTTDQYVGLYEDLLNRSDIVSDAIMQPPLAAAR